MPKTDIIVFQDRKATLPSLLRWIDSLPKLARDKCFALIERLAERGYELRRPYCDYLRDGIYELRSSYKRTQHRILYSFADRNVVLLSHGCTKDKTVPVKEIEKAIKNFKAYKQSPDAHTYKGEI